MPPIIRISSAFIRRLCMIILAPILFLLLVCTRVSKGIQTGCSEFSEMFSAVWKGVQEDPTLLPCPFCGGKCLPHGWQTQGGATGPACDNCGATTWSVDTWNSRVMLTEEQLKLVQNEEEMNQ